MPAVDCIVQNCYIYALRRACGPGGYFDLILIGGGYFGGPLGLDDARAVITRRSIPRSGDNLVCVLHATSNWPRFGCRRVKHIKELRPWSRVCQIKERAKKLTPEQRADIAQNGLVKFCPALLLANTGLDVGYTGFAEITRFPVSR